MSTPPISTTFPVLGAREKALIGYCLTYQRRYGLVTKYAEKYGVSRQTIYAIESDYRQCLEAVWSPPLSVPAPVPMDLTLANIAEILSLRLEGRCSLASIQKILTRRGAKHTSIGYISQTLTEWGQRAGNTLDLPTDHQVEALVYATDEIYANNAPVLIVVDPRSLAILRIELCDDRSGASWERQFSALAAQNIYPNLIVKDEGPGMQLACKKLLPGVLQQSDTFHAVAHRLGEYKRRYERAAHCAIQAEYAKEAQYNNAKSTKTKTKYYECYFKMKSTADQAIALYDEFCFLYHTLLRAFQIFDKGALNNKTQIIADFDAAIDLLPLLKHPNKDKISADIQAIRNCRPTLFTFLDKAQQVVKTLAQTIDSWVLQPLCRAWQAHKNSIKAKDPTRKKREQATERAALNEAQFLLPNAYHALKDRVYQQLNTITQSSAAVESINSLLRPYFNNSRNNITQESLNLFMFYHNHRLFDQGERKGKSPMQILTGSNDSNDWFTLLAQKAKS